MNKIKGSKVILPDGSPMYDILSDKFSNKKLIEENNKHKKEVFLVILVVLVLAGGSYLFQNRNKLIGDFAAKKENASTQPIITEKPKTVSCTRTARLENKPYFDRALSLIDEKYKGWDGDNYLSWYFFPPELTNCIKVIEGDIRKTDNVEGYFVFNGNEIKDNYFPIFVDKDYVFSDDVVNSLLLVHEITHVRQYLDVMNGKSDLSCIDKEVEAFYAEWMFYRAQIGETKKSIDLRIEYDKELNPQLQIIKSINDRFSSKGIVMSITELCKGKNMTTSECITQDQENTIKPIIDNDEFYKKLCAGR